MAKTLNNKSLLSTNNIATQLTGQVNKQCIVPSTNVINDVIQLTLTLKMTTPQVVET